jgi:hypothetical protein
MRCAKVILKESKKVKKNNLYGLCFFKANPHIRRVKCSFNATHLTTPGEMFKHMSTCPDNQAVHDAIARGMGDFSKI